MALPRARRRLEALQLPKSFEDAVLARQTRGRGEMLPVEQPAHELGGSDRSNLTAEGAKRQAMNAGEQSPLTPLQVFRTGKRPTKGPSHCLESKKRVVNPIGLQAEHDAELSGSRWP